jgi:hypothetical protein
MLGGLPPFDEDFYLAKGDQSAVLVELTTSRDKEDKDIRFEEARQLNGIR